MAVQWTTTMGEGKKPPKGKAASSPLVWSKVTGEYRESVTYTLEPEIDHSYISNYINKCLLSPLPKYKATEVSYLMCSFLVTSLNHKNLLESQG